MGLPFSGLSDKGIGTCCCHSHPTCRTSIGTIIKGSSNVLVNGKPAATLTSKVLGSCGHVSIIINGASKTKTNGLPSARLTSKFASSCYTGTIIKGSSNVNVG